MLQTDSVERLAGESSGAFDWWEAEEVTNSAKIDGILNLDFTGEQKQIIMSMSTGEWAENNIQNDLFKESCNRVILSEYVMWGCQWNISQVCFSSQEEQYAAIFILFVCFSY